VPIQAEKCELTRVPDPDNAGGGIG